MWLRRLQASGVVSPYNKYYDPNGSFNIYTGSVRMPNCTAYAYLRAQEAEQLIKRDPYLINSNGGFGNAKTWYATTPLPKGSVLREGAIAVFDGNCGHVAIVEKKINDHHAILSESNYDDDKSRRDWKYWQTRDTELIVGQSTISGVGPLIGYIYLDIDDKRVLRNGNKDQLRVNYDYINVRQGPGLDSPKYSGCFCPDGIYDILDTAEADGYTWYKLADNYWIAGIEEVEILPKSGDKILPTKSFGLDISEWQRGISISQLKSEGMEFAILRAGFTGWGDGVTKRIDDCFETFYSQCKENNIPVGAYWYSCANTYEKGKAEAKFMIENCLKNKHFELPIAIDVEDEHNQRPAGREAITAAINGFCDYLKEHNYFPMVYANSSWFKNYIGNITWDKWIAQWSTVKPDNCGIWQYSSSEYMAGQRIDSNYMYKDYESYIKEHGLNIYKGEDEMAILPVEKDIHKNQVFVGTSGLRMRDEASTDSEITGYCEENAYYDTFGTATGEGYTWYHLGPDAWIAKVDGVEYFPAQVDPEPEPTPSWVAPSPVNRNDTVDQIYIGDIQLRFRDEPDVESKAMGLSESDVYYNVLARQSKEDYTWYNLGKDAWVAGVEEVEFLPKKEEPQPEPEPEPQPEPTPDPSGDIQKLIEDLMRQLATVAEQVKVLEQEKVALITENTELRVELANKGSTVAELENRLDQIKDLANY